MAKARKKKLSELVVSRKLAPDSKSAIALIMAGKVVVGDQRIDKPGAMVNPGVTIRVKDTSKYVGRGGDKLEGALVDFGLDDQLSGTVALDIGASTGGFTDCLLDHGCEKVIALDVGTNQLHWKLREDARVVSVEKTDIRDFERDRYPVIDLVVGDISFNSLARLAEPIAASTASQDARFLLLVKPQFELKKSLISEGGMVEDEGLHKMAVDRVVDAFQGLGKRLVGIQKSKVLGRKGNQEYFVLMS